MRKAVSFLFAAMTLAAAAGQQKSAEPGYAEPPYSAAQAMPSDRAAAAYAIYSQLLPGNHIEWGDAQRSFWALEAITKAEPLTEPCSTGGMMNPHRSVKPPQQRQAEFAELLTDYDAHCHDRYLLDASRFQLQLPVHLLDDAARQRYVNGVMHYLPPADDIMRAPATPDEFKGAAGMHSFTAVYFNHAHTLALTEIGMYCGGLCGNWKWVVLEQKEGVWRVLPWVYTYTIS